MDPDERKPYSEEARKEKEWHKRMYPDYVYRAPNTSSATANAEKVKGFKIKVKTGNPSKSKKSPSPPRQEHPLSDIEFVSVQPLQWQETPSLQTTHVTEHEFVPTECIPPLDLHASHQECQQESDLKPVCCFFVVPIPCLIFFFFLVRNIVLPNNRLSQLTSVLGL